MKNNKKLLALAGVAAIATLLSLLILHLTSKPVNGTIIIAEVIGVIDKPNRAEDGYYEITVQDNKGQQHKINATGYLNVPLSPEEFG